MPPLVPPAIPLQAVTPGLQSAAAFEQSTLEWPLHLKGIKERILTGLGNGPGIGYRNGELWQGSIVASDPRKKPLWSLLRPPTLLSIQFNVNQQTATLYYDTPNLSDAHSVRPGLHSYDAKVGSAGLQSIVLFVAATQSPGSFGRKNRIEMFARIEGESLKFGQFEFDSQPKSRFFMWIFDNRPPAPPA